VTSLANRLGLRSSRSSLFCLAGLLLPRADELFIAAPWTYLIETSAIEGWACKTASRMVVDFYEKMPSGIWKQFTEMLVAAFADVGNKRHSGVLLLSFQTFCRKLVLRYVERRKL
jgi:hypothetical protein